MVTTNELHDFIDTTFGTADSKLIQTYDAEGVDAGGDTIEKDGQLDSAEIATIDGGIASAIVTELEDAHAELGAIIDVDRITDDLENVFASGAADISGDGLLSGEEIATAIKSALTVEHFSVVDQEIFLEQTVEDVENASTEGSFDEAGLETYFIELGVSDDNAAVAASALFSSPLVTEQNGQILVGDLLAWMNGTYGSDTPTEDPATFETFNAAMTDILGDATAFDMVEDNNHITAGDMIDLGGGTRLSPLDANHLTTFFEAMGLTNADAEPMAEYVLQYAPRGDGEDVGSENIWAADAVAFIDSFGSNSEDGQIGTEAFDNFVAHVKEQGQDSDETPYVDDFIFSEAEEAGINEDLTLTDLGDEQGAIDFFVNIGVGVSDATNIAVNMTEMNVFNTYPRMTVSEMITGDADGTITIENLNQFVDNALSGNSDVFSAPITYDEGFSQGMFERIGESDEDAGDIVVQQNNFVANILESEGLTAPYNLNDVTIILEKLGVEPTIAENVAQYLIEQKGNGDVIAGEDMFTILARIDDRGGSDSDNVIRTEDITTLIANADSGAAMAAPIEDTANVTAETFSAVSDSTEDDPEDDASTISLAEFTAAGDADASSDDMLDFDGVETLMNAIGVDPEKAEMIANQVVGEEGTISYAELFDLLTDGEATLSIDALQLYIDNIEETRGLPTETELEADEGLAEYHEDGVFSNIEGDATAIADHIASEYYQEGAFEPDAAMLAQMIIEKNDDLIAADADADFTISDLHTVLTEYADGIRSDGEVDDDGSIIIGSSLEDLTETDLLAAGVEDGDIIKLSTSSESAGDIAYLVTENEDGYLIEEADADGTPIEGGEERTIMVTNVSGDTVAAPYELEDTIYLNNITADQLQDAEADGIEYITTSGRSDESFTFEKTLNGTHDTYVIKDAETGDPVHIVTSAESIDDVDLTYEDQNAVYTDPDTQEKVYQDDKGNIYNIEADGNLTSVDDAAADVAADAGDGGDGSAADAPYELEKAEWLVDIDYEHIQEAQGANATYITTQNNEESYSFEKIINGEGSDNGNGGEYETYVIKDENGDPVRIVTSAESIDNIDYDSVEKNAVYTDPDTQEKVYQDVEGNVYNIQENGNIDPDAGDVAADAGDGGDGETIEDGKTIDTAYQVELNNLDEAELDGYFEDTDANKIVVQDGNITYDVRNTDKGYLFYEGGYEVDGPPQHIILKEDVRFASLGDYGIEGATNETLMETQDGENIVFIYDGKAHLVNGDGSVSQEAYDIDIYGNIVTDGADAGTDDDAKGSLSNPYNYENTSISELTSETLGNKVDKYITFADDADDKVYKVVESDDGEEYHILEVNVNTGEVLGTGTAYSAPIGDHAAIIVPMPMPAEFQ